MEDLKEKFYAGFYLEAISAAEELKDRDEEVEFILLRSRILVGQVDFVLNAVKEQKTPLQRGVYLIAKSKKCNSQEEIAKIIPKDDESDLANSEFYSISKATVLIQSGNIEEALPIVSGLKHEESICLKINCFILLSRFDLAEKELQDIENPILKNIWVALVELYQGKDINNGLNSLLDLSERLGISPLIANALACCYYSLGKWDEGINVMQSAAQKYPNDDSVMINLCVGLHRTNDNDKLKTQLEMINTLKNPYVKNLDSMLDEFDKTVELLE